VAICNVIEYLYSVGVYYLPFGDLCGSDVLAKRRATKEADDWG